MSVDLHVFLEQSKFPDRASWQAEIEALSFPVVLDPDLRVATSSGFVSCRVRDTPSGFELFVEDVGPLLDMYPSAAISVASRSAALSFRWGGDLAECACAMVAATALVSKFGGVAFYPDDDLIYTLEALVEESRECIGSF